MTNARSARRYVVHRSGMRLDRFLAEVENCGRRTARRAIAQGRVRIDQRLARAADTPPAGATVTVEVQLPNDDTLSSSGIPTTPQDWPRILWDDGDLVVLAKPAGFHTHAGAREPSVAGWLSEHRPEFHDIGERGIECGIAHRLDRDTSGVLIATANAGSYLELRRWFSLHAITKRYLALATGKLGESSVVDRPLARRRTRVVAAKRNERSWQARTELRQLSGSTEWSLIEARMCTGVTHQVRAHCALAGHPLIGDVKYKGPPAPVGTRSGVLLHAWCITLPDGAQFTAPVPEDFLRALAYLRSSRPRSA